MGSLPCVVVDGVYGIRLKMFCLRVVALQKYTMNFDKNTGVIEMILDSLTPADEGTFTFKIGRAHV